MGLFGSLFGGSRKIDYSQMIPEPPKFSLASGSQDAYTGGLQQLIDVFNNRSQGNDMFDVLKYIYEPQAQQLRQSYGIDTDAGDIYSQRTGSLPQTLASLNQRGLLDTGTSGIIEAQLRSNLNNQLGQAYGSAKTMQRSDIDNSLSALAQLFPQRFQAQNIGSQVDYDNAMNQYNALLQRNQATVGQQQQMDANKSSAWDSGLGLGLNFLSGGLGQGGGFNFGNAFKNVVGTSNPYAQQTQNMFQPRNTYNPYTGSSGQGYGASIPGNQGASLLSNNRLNQYYPF